MSDEGEGSPNEHAVDPHAPVEVDDATDAAQSSAASGKVANKAGIVYLSTVPHGMTVKLVREHLAPYGKIGRVFLQVDESSSRKRWRLYSEGWVEFLRRADARRCARTLNATEVAGKKKPWAGQLWNARYLPRFAWTDITYREANERAVRNKRLALEIQQARRIGKLYKESLEQAKAQERARQLKGAEFRPLPELRRVEQRRAKRRGTGDVGGGRGAGDSGLQAVNNPAFMAQLLGGGK